MKIKTLLLGAAITMMTAVGYSQGTVVFGTSSSQTATNTLTGQRVPTGAGYWAQLYYGNASATADLLVAVTNAPVNFFGAAGRLAAGTRYTDLAILPGGTGGTFQIRAWSAVLGADYSTAFAAYNDPLNANYGTAVLGRSSLFQVKTGDPLGAPPTSPGVFPTTLTGFNLVPVPEPSVIALGALGLAALLYRRRK